MLSPEQAAAICRELNTKLGKAGAGKWGDVADLIERQSSSNAALAEQVRVLREALEDVRAQWPVDYVFRVTEIIDTALALPVPEAARQAQENAEKAGLLEWLTQYSESRFSQWMATYKAGAMLGHIMLLDALRAAKEAGNG